MNYLNVIKQHCPILYKWIKKSAYAIMEPIIQEIIDERTQVIIDNINAVVEKLTVEHNIKIKTSTDKLFQQLLLDKLALVNTDVHKKITEDIAKAEEVVTKRVQEVESKYAELKQSPAYTTSSDIAKLITDICYDMERKFPQAKTGKIKKYNAQLVIDSIAQLPDKRLQWLRQSARAIDTQEYVTIINNMIDTIGRGL